MYLNSVVLWSSVQSTIKKEAKAYRHAKRQKNKHESGQSQASSGNISLLVLLPPKRCRLSDSEEEPLCSPQARVSQACHPGTQPSEYKVMSSECSEGAEGRISPSFQRERWEFNGLLLT